LLDAAKLLMDEGDAARAAICYETVLAQTSQPDVTLFGQLGVARMRAGNLDGAEAAFAALAAQRPSQPRPLYFLGVIAEKRGDAATARAYFERALALDPEFSKAAIALRELDPPRP
jgi:Flp pilus assembly protein TadD